MNWGTSMEWNREGEGDRYWGKLEVKRSGLLYGNYGESQGKDLVFVVVGKKQMKGMESMKMNRGRVWCTCLFGCHFSSVAALSFGVGWGIAIRGVLLCLTMQLPFL